VTVWRAPAALVLASAALVTACARGSDTTASTASSAAAAAEVTTTATRATTVAPAATTDAPATTAPTTPAPTTSAVPTTPPVPDLVQEVEFGRSVDGRPLTAIERGTPGGTVVLVIGVIHGDEPAGTAVVDRLRTLPLPAGIDLWLVGSVNPDGQLAGTRTNRRLVDLNRNFPDRWAPLAEPGDDEYAGEGPASEPETQAIAGLIALLEPDLGLWYHQDLFRIAPASGRNGRVRSRYAELTGLPVDGITGGTYTGTAASWQRRAVPDGVSFIVELGPTLSDEEAGRHAAAVLQLASELPSI
jgi:protein MpaA